MNRSKALMKALLVLLSFILLTSTARAEPRLSATSYLLLDATTGQILVENNGYELRPPASTTKILTCITALDLADLSEIVKISNTADRVGDASIYLETGEMFTLESLIKGALIKSGNDAATAIAEQVAGHEKLFMDLANRKACILGAVNTEFYNPHGLPHEKHLTTAYDLAVIADYSMKNEVFASIVGTRETSISSLNSGRKIRLKNTNKLLWNDNRVQGVKTGTTNKAGKCLVTYAVHEGRKLIAVVLNSGDRFGDSERLLEWGFSRFRLQRLTELLPCSVIDVEDGRPNCITVKPAHDMFLSVPKETQIRTETEFIEPLSAPIKNGETVGRLQVIADNEILAEVPLIAGEEVSPQKRTLFSLLRKIE